MQTRQTIALLLRLLALLCAAPALPLHASRPQTFTNAGLLSYSRGFTTGISFTTGDFNAGQIKWFRLELEAAAPVPGASFLDIFTTRDPGSPELPLFTDTEIALYNDAGDLIMTDDDDGAGKFSQLTWGGSPARTYPAATVAEAETGPQPFDGRDKAGAAATLPAGIYWIAVARYDATFGTTDWQASSSNTSTTGNSVVLQIAAGGYTDIGPLLARDAPTSPRRDPRSTGTFAAGQVKWFKFEIMAAGEPTTGLFLDIFTHPRYGPSSGGGDDTEIALYSATGALLMEDDDDGSGTFSQLTWGRPGTPRTYPEATVDAASAPLPFDGRDQTGAATSLPAGVYWLAVARYNATFGPTNWQATTTSATTANNDFEVVVSAGGLPVTDLGTLKFAADHTSPRLVQLDTPGFAPGQVRWFRFRLPENVQTNNGHFLDIFTTRIPGANDLDTEIALYSSDRDLLFTDDDDGAGNYSALTFGRNANPRIYPAASVSGANPSAFNGDNLSSQLGAGDYWLAVTRYDATFSSSYNAVSTAGTTSSQGVRLVLGSGGMDFVDLGLLGFSGFPDATFSSITTSTGNFNAGQVRWFRIATPMPFEAPDRGLFLDIFTTKNNNSSENVTETDTEIGIYNDSGELIAEDDDSGASFFSQITLGRTDAPRTYNTFANPQPAGTTPPEPFDGLDLTAGRYPLPAGYYWIAVARHNATFGASDWQVASTNTTTTNNGVAVHIGHGGRDAYGAWKVNTFDIAAADPAIGGDDADPDHDGVPNMVEYMTGRSALVSEATGPLHVWAGTDAATGQRFLYFDFPHILGPPAGMSLEVQISSNLQAWTAVPEFASPGPSNTESGVFHSDIAGLRVPLAGRAYTGPGRVGRVERLQPRDYIRLRALRR